jgi:hypothetical protein
MRFPARRARVRQDRVRQGCERPAPGPGGREAPAWGGAGAGRVLWALGWGGGYGGAAAATMVAATEAEVRGDPYAAIRRPYCSHAARLPVGKGRDRTHEAAKMPDGAGIRI